MRTVDLQVVLESHLDCGLAIELPGGEPLPPHFHITEVGKVTKSFVDCGGTPRQTESCMLQTLVADDVDHRLVAGKLAGILKLSGKLGIPDDTPVELECQRETIGIYELESVTPADGRLVMRLRSKQTACLAPDLCGVPEPTVIGIGLGKA